MILKINNVEIAAYPSEFSVTPMDLDDSDASVMTADGTTTRDRIAVKRQVNMSWGPLPWDTMAALLQSMSDVNFELYYPDPMDGAYFTRMFSVGNRPTTIAVATEDEILWDGLKVTLTER